MNDYMDISVNTHSSIRMQGDSVFYFDPWQLEHDNHDADFIFLTHDHYDHFSPDDIARVKKDSTIIVAPEMMRDMILEKTDVSEDMLLLLKPGIVKETEKILIETVPMYNKLKPFHAKKYGYLGYIVTVGDDRYYVAGDTDLTKEVEGVSCDVAFLPIGGFYTMNASEAAKAVSLIKPSVVIPVHYGSIKGTAPYSAEDEFKSKVPKNVEVLIKLH